MQELAKMAAEEERKKKEIEDELKRLDMERRAAMADNLEANYFKLEQERNELANELHGLSERTLIAQKLLQNLTNQRSELEETVEDLQDSLSIERNKG